MLKTYNEVLTLCASSICCVYILWKSLYCFILFFFSEFSGFNEALLNKHPLLRSLFHHYMAGKQSKEVLLFIGITRTFLLESERFEAFRSSQARVYITRGCSHVESSSIPPPMSLILSPFIPNGVLFQEGGHCK